MPEPALASPRAGAQQPRVGDAVESGAQAAAPCHALEAQLEPNRLASGVGASQTRAAKPSAVGPRLLSPEEAARYLGLGSKWAVRRLAASGAFPVLVVAGKCRYDRDDLDAFIERAKSAPPAPRRPVTAHGGLTAVPARLAPRPSRRRVTVEVTAHRADA
jgi:excisionase family DNA binding protein